MLQKLTQETSERGYKGILRVACHTMCFVVFLTMNLLLRTGKKHSRQEQKHGFYIPIMNFEVAEPSKNLETKLDRVGLKLDLLLDLPNSTYQTRVFSDTFVTFANST